MLLIQLLNLKAQRLIASLGVGQILGGLLNIQFVLLNRAPLSDETVFEIVLVASAAELIAAQAQGSRGGGSAENPADRRGSGGAEHRCDRRGARGGR